MSETFKGKPVDVPGDSTEFNDFEPRGAQDRLAGKGSPLDTSGQFSGSTAPLRDKD